jgi:hypothetical protein
MPAAIKLVRGTKEIVPVDIVDRSGTETDLSTYSPYFSVLDDTDGGWYIVEPCTASGMRILPLIDTSATHPEGLWPTGHYRLFVGFNDGVDEEPLLFAADLYLIDYNPTVIT